MPEPRLEPLPAGKLKLHAEHFRKVVRRIEAVKPLAGDNINLEETDDGIKISATGNTGGGLGSCPNLKILTLNVCLDGAPGQIYVLGFDTDGAAELCAEVFAAP